MLHMGVDSLAVRHQALADPLRLRIIRLLMVRELCVCEIMAALREAQYKVSRHLGILRRAGLVRDRREGSWVHYSLEPELELDWRLALHALQPLLDRDEAVSADARRLADLGGAKPGMDRGRGACDRGSARRPGLPRKRRASA